MRNLTQGMTVKETQAWIAEKRRIRNKMTPHEIKEFNSELRLLEEEWSARWEVKAYRYFKGIAVWLGVGLIIIGGMAYKLVE